ncbi:MAG TPA: DUF4124 domain-containing protein [Burkholderiales bacterium]|nr:DUF4124 domain-containing protein [Burkholderiales bacterium]
MLVLLALCAVAGAAAAADVYRWVDEKGKVHYGDTVPDKYKKVAKLVAAQDVPSAEDLRAAQQRANQDKGRLEQLRSKREAAALSQPSATAEDTNKKLGCADQWARYNESSACFESYRIGGNRTVGTAPPSDPNVPQPPLIDGKPAPPGSVVRKARPISPEAADNCKAYPKPDETSCPRPR